MTSGPDGTPRAPPARLDRRGLTALGSALVLLVALTLWRFGTDSAATVHDFVGPTMGTSYRVRVQADLTASERGRVAEIIQARLDEVEQLMSTYDPASELSRFNQRLSTEPDTVGALLLDVLAMAREVSIRSEGAFDVTVAPLVEAWGFGPVKRLDRAPDPKLVAELMTRVGYEKIVLDRGEATASKTIVGAAVDLSGIAKGFAVDRVAAGLQESGFPSFLVEVGGELRAGAPRREGTPWRVGVESPDTAARRIHATLGLVDQALATSGDYRNFFEEGGVRYAHIIDPRSGTPIRYAGASVSVVHDDGAMADGWATALSVLGPGDGFDLALREGVAALFVMQTPSGFRSHATPAFFERVVQYTEVGAR